MKQNLLTIAAVTVFVLLGTYIFLYMSGRNFLAADTTRDVPIYDLSGEEISRLENGKIVRFPATVIQRGEDSCIELFANDDFNEYGGDGKHAVLSRLAEGRRFDRLGEHTSGVVTGNMIFVRVAAGDINTCGIVNGNIFEITDIEKF